MARLALGAAAGRGTTAKGALGGGGRAREEEWHHGAPGVVWGVFRVWYFDFLFSLCVGMLPG